MKPSWDNAPDWAKYLAMDSDGSWWWWSDKPYQGVFDWYRYDAEHELAGVSRWADTLEERPETNDE